MKKYIFFLTALSLLPLLSLISPGLPVTHDGQDHVVRVANFYQSLTEGNFIPRWGGNLNWGFGHPVMMFLYPLPSYIASFFHMTGVTLVDSVKATFAVAYVFSIIAMFIFAREEWGNEAGFVAAVLYGFAPYRFVNLYVRGALGEHVAFVFLPLILLGMYGIATKKHSLRWSLMLSFSYAGLFLAHNAVSVMMLPIILTYGVYLLFYKVQEKKYFTFLMVCSILLGIGLSSFFLLPAFLEGKYTLRDIVTQGEISARVVNPSFFLWSEWNYGGGNEFTKQIGFPSLITTLMSIVFLLTVKERRTKAVLISMMLLLMFYVFLMTSASLFVWNSVTLLQKFQFPWRLLVIISLISGIVGALVTFKLPNRFRRPFIVGIVCLTIISTYFMWMPKGYKVYDESFFTSVYNGTTDTGESSPIWSVRFMEFRPVVPVEVAEGEVEINQLFRNTTRRTYKISVLKKSRLVENTLYFPGWHIIVDGKETQIEFQDPQWRGRMTYWVDPGEHTVEVIFKDTKLRRVANGISVFSIFLVAVLCFGERFFFKKHVPSL